jgi:hypothetical protein
VIFSLGEIWQVDEDAYLATKSRFENGAEKAGQVELGKLATLSGGLNGWHGRGDHRHVGE